MLKKMTDFKEDYIFCNRQNRREMSSSSTQQVLSKEAFLEYYEAHKEELDGYRVPRLNQMFVVNGCHISRSKKNGIQVKEIEKIESRLSKHDELMDILKRIEGKVDRLIEDIGET
jgi:hypothetical protein